jgi:hypothetical protein
LSYNDLLRQIEELKREIERLASFERAVSGGGGGGGAPDDAQYVTLATNGTLTNERVLTPGNGLAGTDGGAGSTYTLAVNVDDSTIEINSDTLRAKDDGITNTKLANMAESTVKGRAAGAGTGDPTDLTATQATAILNNFVGDSGSGGTKGLVPAPSAGDAAADKFLKANGSWVTPSALGAVPLTVEGRLTLTSGTPVLTSNVTGATTIYFTPFRGNRIALYDGSSAWEVLTFSELSISIPLTGAYRLYDVFIYNNAGTPTLEITAWNEISVAITGATNASPIVITSNGHGLSNNDLVAVTGVGGNTAANGIWSIANVTANTFELEGSTGSGAYTSGGAWYKLNQTRATALTTQNGVLVKNGATTRRYLGTFMTTGTVGQTEMQFDFPSNLLLWNYYNRVFGRFTAQDTTSHTYTSATARVYRNQNSNKAAFVIGVFEENPAAAILTEFNFDSGDGAVTAGAGINRTGAVQFVTRVADVLDARYLNDFGLMVPNTGYNFLQLTQTGAATSPDFQRAIIRGQFFL